ncbi:MAG: ABC transporter permease [Cyanobacteria bacterium P01_A01_bin.84]
MIQKTSNIISTFALFLTGILLGYVLSQLFLGYIQINLVNFLGTISLILIFGTLYYIIFWNWRKKQTAKYQQERGFGREEAINEANTLTSGRTSTVASGIGNARHYYEDRLIKMLDGDEEEAHRLFEEAKQEHEDDMPENFYWEKALDKLRREQTNWE